MHSLRITCFLSALSIGLILPFSTQATNVVSFQGKPVSSLGEVRALIETHPDFSDKSKLDFKNSGPYLKWPTPILGFKCGHPMRKTSEHIHEDSADLKVAGDSLELARCITESEFSRCYTFVGKVAVGSHVQILSFKNHFLKGSTPHMRYKEGIIALQISELAKGKSVLQAYGILGGAEEQKLDTSGTFTGKWPSKWIPAHYGPNTDLAFVELTCSTTSSTSPTK